MSRGVELVEMQFAQLEQVWTWSWCSAQLDQVGAQLGLTHVQERLCALKHQNSVKYCSARSGPGLKINHEGTQQTKQAESGEGSGCISCVENEN